MSEENADKQIEMRGAFGPLMKLPLDQRKQAIEERCRREGEKCAKEANDNLNECAPEADESRKLTNARLKFGCQMPDCVSAWLYDPESGDLTNLIAECIARMCNDFKRDVIGVNGM